MKPSKSILDKSFAYTAAAATAVENTWRRFGWQPVTEQERKNRLHNGLSANDASVAEMKLRSA